MQNRSMHRIPFRVTTRTFRYDSSLIKHAQAVMIPISIRGVRFEILLGHTARPSRFTTFRSGKFRGIKIAVVWDVTMCGLVHTNVSEKPSASIMNLYTCSGNGGSKFP